jgi:heme-degrading monooxygenase HmoA
MELVLIDTFCVPQASREAFLARAQQAQGFIKTLPGFVEGFLYERRDDADGQQQIITVAVWEDAQALEHARHVVVSRDKEQGVDRQAVLRQLGVELTRAIYARTPY